MQTMKATILFQKPIEPLSEQESEIAHGTERELTEALQAKRQQLDLSIEDVIEGFVETQQILNELKTLCFSVSTPFIRPIAKLKVQRTSHHCNRILTEVQHLLQPFSQELLLLLSLEVSSFSSKIDTSQEDEEKGDSYAQEEVESRI